MKKKTISLIMALCMSFLAIVPASAADVTANSTDLAAMSVAKEMLAQYPLAERIEDAKSGKVDNAVEEDIRGAVTVSVSSGQKNMARTANTLTEDVVADVDYSIKNLGEVVVDGESVGTLYSATGVQKTKTGSKELNDVNVEAYLTVVWIDNTGYDNVLVEVSGGWNDRWGYYKDMVNAISAPETIPGVICGTITFIRALGDSDTQYPSGDSFTYDNINYHGLSISAASFIDIDVSNPNSDPEMKTFRLSVSPTIFD